MRPPARTAVLTSNSSGQCVPGAAKAIGLLENVGVWPPKGLTKASLGVEAMSSPTSPASISGTSAAARQAAC